MGNSPYKDTTLVFSRSDVDIDTVVIIWISTQLTSWLLLELFERQLDMAPVIRRRTSFTRLTDLGFDSADKKSHELAKRLMLTKGLDKKGRFRIQTRGSIYFIKAIWVMCGAIYLTFGYIVWPAFYYQHFLYFNANSIYFQPMVNLTALISSFYSWEMMSNRYAKLNYSVMAHHWLSAFGAILMMLGVYNPLLSWYGIFGIFIGSPILLSLGIRANYASACPKITRFFFWISYLYYMLCLVIVFGGGITLVTLLWMSGSYYTNVGNYISFGISCLSALAFGYDDIILLRALKQMSGQDYKHAQMKAKPKTPKQTIINIGRNKEIQKQKRFQNIADINTEANVTRGRFSFLASDEKMLLKQMQNADDGYVIEAWPIEDDDDMTFSDTNTGTHNLILNLPSEMFVRGPIATADTLTEDQSYCTILNNKSSFNDSSGKNVPLFSNNITSYDISPRMKTSEDNIASEMHFKFDELNEIDIKDVVHAQQLILSMYTQKYNDIKIIDEQNENDESFVAFDTRTMISNEENSRRISNSFTNTSAVTHNTSTIFIPMKEAAHYYYYKSQQKYLKSKVVDDIERDINKIDPIHSNIESKLPSVNVRFNFSPASHTIDEEAEMSPTGKTTENLLRSFDDTSLYGVENSPPPELPKPLSLPMSTLSEQSNESNTTAGSQPIPRKSTSVSEHSRLTNDYSVSHAPQFLFDRHLTVKSQMLVDSILGDILDMGHNTISKESVPDEQKPTNGNTFIFNMYDCLLVCTAYGMFPSRPFILSALQSMTSVTADMPDVPNLSVNIESSYLQSPSAYTSEQKSNGDITPVSVSPPMVKTDRSSSSFKIRPPPRSKRIRHRSHRKHKSNLVINKKIKVKNPTRKRSNSMESPSINATLLKYPKDIPIIKLSGHYSENDKSDEDVLAMIVTNNSSTNNSSSGKNVDNMKLSTVKPKYIDNESIYSSDSSSSSTSSSLESYANYNESENISMDYANVLKIFQMENKDNADDNFDFGFEVVTDDSSKPSENVNNTALTDSTSDQSFALSKHKYFMSDNVLTEHAPVTFSPMDRHQSVPDPKNYQKMKNKIKIKVREKNIKFRNRSGSQDNIAQGVMDKTLSSRDITFRYRAKHRKSISNVIQSSVALARMNRIREQQQLLNENMSKIDERLMFLNKSKSVAPVREQYKHVIPIMNEHPTENRRESFHISSATLPQIVFREPIKAAQLKF